MGPGVRFQQHLVLLLASLSVLVPVTMADEVTCMSTMEQCTQAVGYSEILMTNDDVFCCAAGYSMRFDNNSDCFCNQTSDVVVCDEGPEACANSSSTAPHPHSSSNITRCCQQGFHMQLLHGYINGTRVESCTCSSSQVTGYVVTSFWNGSVSNLHFVNYQGQPLSGSLSLGVYHWVRQRMHQMREFINHLFQSVW
ncbi:uncharacterized protein LOC143292809 [Babylonia areolata]|uniref:uncharacterized protein LOC143292809 n=1 Tax=Babylonia areolata TaxID=304850 RepID=UPI003FD646D5